MKTKLQKELAKIISHAVIETIWERDRDGQAEFKKLQAPGEAFENEKQKDWVCWQSEVKVRVISGGKAFEHSTYLSGTWERKGSAPSKVNQNISGYENQMTRDALIALKEKGATGLDIGIKFITAKMDEEYDAQMAEHPSGLSGEHDVVLDAIQQECLGGQLFTTL
jgi:hypothetical protein